MDDNYAEESILPFTIGRKNFELIDPYNIGRASAMIYILVETAKGQLLESISVPGTATY